jgi:hypothetical protein
MRFTNMCMLLVYKPLLTLAQNKNKNVLEDPIDCSTIDLSISMPLITGILLYNYQIELFMTN